MDRVTVALSATEDNAAAIRDLNKALAQRTTCRYIVATIGDGTSFGEVTSSGKMGAVVTFSGATAVLNFCGERVAISSSPIVAVIPAGRGELKLETVRQNGRALLIGQ